MRPTKPYKQCNKHIPFKAQNKAVSNILQAILYFIL